MVVALADERTLKVARPVASWACENKAVLLAVDPPPLGTPGIPVRFSLVPALPLAHTSDNGKLFLVNLAIPQKVFWNNSHFYCLMLNLFICLLSKIQYVLATLVGVYSVFEKKMWQNGQVF